MHIPLRSSHIITPSLNPPSVLKTGITGSQKQR